MAYLIGSAPTCTSTVVGQLQDEATYWAASPAYRDITQRDYVRRQGMGR